MDTDARSTGTTAQNAELVAAAWADSLLDAPIWIYNKATNSDVPAPLHLASGVYAEQTVGQFTDPNGEPLSQAEIEAEAAGAEDQGKVLEAAQETAGQISSNPFSIVPTWAWIAAAGVAILVAGYYAISIYRVIK